MEPGKLKSIADKADALSVEVRELSQAAENCGLSLEDIGLADSAAEKLDLLYIRVLRLKNQMLALPN